MNARIFFFVFVSVLKLALSGAPTTGDPYDASLAVLDGATPFPLQSTLFFTVDNAPQSAGLHLSTNVSLEKSEVLTSFGNNTYSYEMSFYSTDSSDLMPLPIQLPGMSGPSVILGIGIGAGGNGIAWTSTLGAIVVRSSSVIFYNDTNHVVAISANLGTSTNSNLFCQGGLFPANAKRIYKVSCFFIVEEIASTTGSVTSSPLTTSPLTSSPITSAALTSAEMTTSPLTTSPVTSAHVTSSPLTTSAITSSPMTSAGRTTGVAFTTGSVPPITSGVDVTTGEITSGEITSGEITSGSDVTTSNPVATSGEASTEIASTGGPSEDRGSGPLIAAIVVPIAVSLLIIVFIVVLISVKRSRMQKEKDIEMSPKKETSNAALVKTQSAPKKENSSSEYESDTGSESSSKSGSSSSKSESGSESGSESSSSGESKATSGSEVSADKSRKK